MAIFRTICRVGKILWLCFLLAGCLLVERSCQRVTQPVTCYQEPAKKPRRDYWRGFHGPAYLQYPLQRKPKQARLDSLARVMRFRKV